MLARLEAILMSKALKPAANLDSKFSVSLTSKLLIDLNFVEVKRVGQAPTPPFPSFHLLVRARIHFWMVVYLFTINVKIFMTIKLNILIILQHETKKKPHLIESK